MRVVISEVCDVLAIETKNGAKFFSRFIGFQFQFGDFGKKNLVLERGGKHMIGDVSHLW